MSKDRDGYWLTPEQAAAVEQYIEHGSMSDAFRHAYDTSNTKPESVWSEAFRLFAQPHVAAAVVQRRAGLARGSAMSREEAIEILKKMATAKRADYLDERGEVDPAKLRLGGPAIKEIIVRKSNKGTTWKVKLEDPVQAMELLAKMCGADGCGEPPP